MRTFNQWCQVAQPAARPGILHEHAEATGDDVLGVRVGEDDLDAERFGAGLDDVDRLRVRVAVEYEHVARFAVEGLGTPAPIAPPKHLVVSGIYRFVRNPMYVGVLTVIFGHFLRFGYWIILGYAGIFFLVVHSFVTLYEEPDLRKRFGTGYEEYLREVPRWVPRFK